MPTWPALLLAPLLALADLSIVYALSMPECETQRIGVVHAVHALFLLAALALTVMAWREARRQAAETPPPAPTLDADTAPQRRHFVSHVAIGLGALSSLVIAAMWIPPWVLSPCFA
jgi:hypothetical protein